MTNYLITAHAKLFTIIRIVQANSKAEAVAQVNQDGINLMWVEEAVFED